MEAARASLLTVARKPQSFVEELGSLP